MVIRILFVDDDAFLRQLYVNHLEMSGFSVDVAGSPDEAIESAMDRQYNVVVLDLMMPHGTILSPQATEGGFMTGAKLLDPLRKLQEKALYVGLSNTTNVHATQWFRQAGGIFYQKQDYPPSEFAEELRRRTGGGTMKPRAFIVHGHDNATKLELKNYLQNRLGFEEPVILSEKPSRGRTIIEQFEEHARNTDVAFALITPDDYAKADGSGRARQNVILELGYFLGALGRRTGRVFLLKKGDVEIPSDLHGVIYIDISHGIEAAGESIRKELEALP